MEPALRDFIESAFPSVWTLETFLALKRTADTAWTVDQLVSNMRANTVLVSDCLQHLDRVGLIALDDKLHRYQPASKKLEFLADELDAAYATRPFAITNVITSRRSDPLKGFADSFRLGGWKT